MSGPRTDDLVAAIIPGYNAAPPGGVPERPVGRALAQVLGEADAEKVFAQAADKDAAAPASHLVLLWISAHMPRMAEEVLGAARLHYAEAAAA